MRTNLRKVGRRIKTWLEASASFFYPEVCQHCGREHATAPEGYIGAECRERAQIIVPPLCERCGLPFQGDITGPFSCANCRETSYGFRTARSAVVAQGMVLDLLHLYKYHHALWVEPFLASLLVRAASDPLRTQSWDMIVPVPLHPLKQFDREFNQAERLARHLSRATGLPVAPRVLRRSQPTQTQTHLHRAARAENVRRAFRLDQAEGVRRKRVVLVDDVFTTGATTDACARLLRQAGARDVCVWTVARGLFH